MVAVGFRVDGMRRKTSAINPPLNALVRDYSVSLCQLGHGRVLIESLGISMNIRRRLLRPRGLLNVATESEPASFMNFPSQLAIAVAKYKKPAPLDC